MMMIRFSPQICGLFCSSLHYSLARLLACFHTCLILTIYYGIPFVDGNVSSIKNEQLQAGNEVKLFFVWTAAMKESAVEIKISVSCFNIVVQICTKRIKIEWKWYICSAAGTQIFSSLLIPFIKRSSRRKLCSINVHKVKK